VIAQKRFHGQAYEIVQPHPAAMRLKAVITYKSSRAREVSVFKTQGRAEDHVAFAADAIAQLRKRQRRQLTIVSVMVHDPDAAAA
jgi:hypothetical protein